MSWFTRLRNVFRADEVSDEIEREMAFHVAERTDDLVAAGQPPEAARREARRRFGAYMLQKEDTRGRDLLVGLETLGGDVRYALRGLRGNPVFCLTALLTLAIGIGANTTVFTLLHGLLLRGLPVVAPQELARIGVAGLTGPSPAFVVPYRMLQQLRRQQRSFVGISAWGNGSVALEDQDGTLRQHVAGLVSGDAFELLGLRPGLGRLISPSDDVRGGPAEGWPLVLSDGFWRDRFGGDPGVVGTTVKISGTVVTVVGVAPPSFHGVWPGIEPRLYLPMQFLPVLAGGDDLDSPTSFMRCAAIGRLRPGVSLAEATAEIAVYQRRLLRDFTPPDVAGALASRTRPSPSSPRGPDCPPSSAGPIRGRSI